MTIDRDGDVECIEGATVSLLKNEAEVGSMETDSFGDCKFENLPPESDPYIALITADGCVEKRIEFTLSDSLYLGEIQLTSKVS